MNLAPIHQAVRQAAALCQEVQRRHVVRSEKSGHEPVTIADYGSQAIICRTLMNHFPQCGVLSEESGAQFLGLVSVEQRDYICGLIGEILGEPVTEQQVAAWLDYGKQGETHHLWVIDPIDGTKGFLAQRHYVIAVGLMEARRPVGAVIGAPEYPEHPGGLLLYTRDGAAYSEPLAGGEPQRLAVSTRTLPAEVRALESVEKGHVGRTRLARVRELVGISEDQVGWADSQEKYSRIAAGDAEVYVRLPRRNSTRPHSIWDHAPGVALLEAAGGRVSDVDGQPLDFSSGSTLNNYGVVASNGPLHDALVNAVQQMLAEEEHAT
jgi:HAL2 family 3'(2'),5'-bisphosphate nucleotidase